MLAPKARKAWNLKDLDSWMHIHWNQALERDCFIFALRSGNLASGMRWVQRMFAAVCGLSHAHFYDSSLPEIKKACWDQDSSLCQHCSICFLAQVSLLAMEDTDISGLMSALCRQWILIVSRSFPPALRKFKAEAGLRILFFGEYIVFVLLSWPQPRLETGSTKLRLRGRRSTFPA